MQDSGSLTTKMDLCVCKPPSQTAHFGPQMQPPASFSRGIVKIRRVGSSLVLISLQIGAEEFGTTPDEFEKALGILHVPTVAIKGTKYFSLFSFEQTMFAALRPGGKSWIFGIPMDFNANLSRRMKVWYEMGLSSLTYSHASTRILRRRIRNAARVLFRKTVQEGLNDIQHDPGPRG